MTLLDTEIREQPAAVGRLLDRAAGDLSALRDLAAGVTGVTFVARGSSDNAARYAQYLVPLRSGVQTALAVPSLTSVYGRAPRFTGQLVVAVSQSGRSTDVISVVEAARAQRRPTVVVTNDVSSPLASLADHVVDLVAGEERSVAATKTYTCSLVAMAVLAVALGPRSDDDVARTELDRLPFAMTLALDLAEGPAAATAAALRDARRAVTVGRGLNLSTAHEAALKITELTATQVVAYSPADLLHGPVAAVGPDVPALLAVPDESASAATLDVVADLRRRGATVHLLGPAVAGGPDTGSGTVVPGPAGVPPWLTPVTTVVGAQLVARHLAVARGVDVDTPGGLSKVTVTH